MGTLLKVLGTFMTEFPSVLLRIRNVSEKVLEKIKTHILYSIIFSRNSCRVRDNAEKYGTAMQDTGQNMIQRRKDARCVADN
jgi:hypothetical protein